MTPVVHPESVTSWIGALSGTSRREATSTIRAIIRSYDDGSFATLVLTDDKKKFWVKALGNPQGDQILVTEAVVSGIGRLIDAPVRPTSSVSIPPELNGLPYGPVRFRTGIAHGSLHLEAGEERDELTYLRRDHNPQRRARLLALWDWCMGDDAQWLYDQSADYSIWSFDHGFWLGGDGGDWDSAMLQRLVHLPWNWRDVIQGIDLESLTVCAATMRAITSDEILVVLRTVRPEWGTSDAELETLGWFLFNRKSDVADRLDELANSLRLPKWKEKP